ncbi:MAG: lipopolysaccharide core biosynthesis protein rfaS [Flavobacterium sp.]
MKVLFCCPDYFGIHKVIEKGIENNLNAELKTVIFKNYQYKSSFHKILNFLSKTFLKRNLKKIWASKERINQIPKDETYDFLLVICPDFFTEEDLKYISKKAKHTIVYFWDSFANIPRYKKTLPYFETCYSFEPRDVSEYGMKLLTNFYYNTDKNTQFNNDVFFIGKLDDRIETILKIIPLIKEKNKKTNIILQTNDKKLISKYKESGINLIEKAIPVQESEMIYRDSKIILDVQKTIQNGLTFRVFEAMGQRKKLITTNKDIINYDFYNPNNIFIWDEKTTEIPNAFFDTSYQELPEEIFKKYSIDNWVKTVFKIP